MHPLIGQWGAQDLARLVERRIAAGGGGRIGFYSRADRTVREQPQAAFLTRAAGVRDLLVAHGARPGRPVLVVAPNPEVALSCFLGAVLCGAVPAIHAARPAFEDEARFRTGLAAAIEPLGPDTVVVVQAKGSTPAMPVPELPGRVLVDLEAIGPAHAPASRSAVPPEVGPASACHLQLTSGSTGPGKPVVVTHAALLHNLSAQASRMELTADACVVSWLPLYHDMGLIAQALFGIAAGIDLHLFSPFDFLADPNAWIRALSDKRATALAAPNFAFDYLERRLRDGDRHGLDLGRLTHVMCGAEPISARTLARFVERFRDAGISVADVKPGYGLAEACVGVTMAHPGVVPRWLSVRAADLHRLGPLEILAEGRLGDPFPELEGATEVISVGSAFDDHDVWIRDEGGARVDADDVCGEVMVAGPSVTAGYRRPDGSVEPFAGGVVATGDVGFLHDGELYVVERIKNIVIRNGENHSAQLLEQTLAAVTGLPIDQMTVIDSDLRPGRGLVTAVVEMERKGDPVELEALVRAGLDRFALPLEELVVVRPGAIPRTTSGKKRHAETRAMLAEGTLKVVDRFPLAAPEPLPAPTEVIDVDLVDAEHRARAVLARVAAQRGFTGELRDDHRLVLDLHFDSLAVYEAAMTVEAECSVEIAEDDIAGLHTVADVAALVRHRRERPEPAERRGLTRIV